MTKFSTLLLALTIGLASASPLYPRDDSVDFNKPFKVILINMCDDDCLAEHAHDWSISQILPNSGDNMTATTMNDYPGEHGKGGDIYPVVGKIPFASAADKGDVKENGHVFFVDRPATKSERQDIEGGGVDALDRNWRCTISINEHSILKGVKYQEPQVNLDDILKELLPQDSPGHYGVVQYMCSKDPIPGSV